MKFALDLETKKIIDILPDEATKESPFLITNNYMLFEAEETDVVVAYGLDEDTTPMFRDLTEEELYPYLKAQWKKERQLLVDNIEVTYNDVIYQGDEASQDRMSRALNAMPDDTTISWKAKDNSTQELTKTDLKEILYLAGQEQTRLWFENEPTITQGE